MIFSADTQWWQMCLALAAALVLSTAIGFERQSKNKSAGMRTHAMVGLGAALFMVVSKYGFSDVLAVDLVRLDPSRLAAQVVSGIGFIGAGLVFVRRNQVRGLTTAASIWGSGRAPIEARSGRRSAQWSAYPPPVAGCRTRRRSRQRLKRGRVMLAALRSPSRRGAPPLLGGI